MPKLSLKEQAFVCIYNISFVYILHVLYLLYVFYVCRCLDLLFIQVQIFGALLSSHIELSTVLKYWFLVTLTLKKNSQKVTE